MKKGIIVGSYSSPCGELLLGSYGEQLCMCNWLHGKPGGSVGKRLRRELRADFELGISRVNDRARRQLDEYFSGLRREFDVPLLLAGSPFQKMVWEGLMTIPYGNTKSYISFASGLGCPKAVRAVANAIGANAISIIVPCHRVIGADGSLTGFAGGLEAKEYLLRLEGAI